MLLMKSRRDGLEVGDLVGIWSIETASEIVSRDEKDIDANEFDRYF